MMKQHSVLLYIVLSISVFSVSCVSDTEEAPVEGGTVSYNSQIRPILESKCQACHAGFFGSYSSVISSNAGSYGEKLVIAGDAENSPLYDKVQLSVAPKIGARMPQGGALTSTQVSFIKTWIDEGALNN